MSTTNKSRFFLSSIQIQVQTTGTMLQNVITTRFHWKKMNEKPDFIGKKMKNHKRENKGTTQRRECQRDPILENQI